jgi:hypothetical protein
MNIRISKTSLIPTNIVKEKLSTVCECSVISNGLKQAVSGNFFYCESDDGGSSWQYMDALEQFPDINTGYFNDQSLLYIPGRQLTCWVLQSDSPKQDGAFIRTATLVLAVQKEGSRDWQHYVFKADEINAGWKNYSLDFSHAVFSNNYLYLSSNVFDVNDIFIGSFVMRLSLEELKNSNGLAPAYFSSSSKEFVLRCVNGAADTMYFATHPFDNIGNGVSQTDRLIIYSWPDNTSMVSRHTVPIEKWNATLQFEAVCADGNNWLQRTDYRITGAWLANGVLGFMWTANKRGKSRPHPYIKVVRINAATMQLVDEPDLWSKNAALAYPDAHPNINGVIGCSFFMGGKDNYPTHIVAVYDEKANIWVTEKVLAGSNSPYRGLWGDYLTIRPHWPEGKDWIAAAHTLQGGKTFEFVQIHTVQFGVE